MHTNKGGQDDGESRAETVWQMVENTGNPWSKTLGRKVQDGFLQSLSGCPTGGEFRIL